MPDRELAEIAARQHGLITRSQALAHLSREQLHHRLRTGRLVSGGRGIYRVAGTPPTWHQALLAACWGADRGAVASHWSAAALWRMASVHAGPPEITVPAPRRVRVAGVTAHESNLLTAEFVTTVEGIPVTTPARTLVDLSAVAHPYFVERVADDALRLRLLTLRQWHDCFEAMAKRGRRRVAWLRPLLEARPLSTARADSGAEAAVVRLLVEAGLPPPVHQHQVAAGGRVFVLDLAYPAERVAIEYDGWPVHGSRSAFDHDRARDNALTLAGWTVVRFTSASGPNEIVTTVRAALRQRARRRAS